MVAMRVCVKCWQSSASISAAANAKLDFFVSCLPSRYIAGSIRMPASAPITRQPNGNHAENRNAKAHDDLAKRRMARFHHGASAVQVLIRRAGVVNLVEIGAVPPARQTFQRILLVENIVCVAVQGGFFHHVQLRNDRRRNAVAVCVMEDDFIHLQPDLLRRDAGHTAQRI